MSELRVRPVAGLPRLRADHDLADLLAAALAPAGGSGSGPGSGGLVDGDVVCVSSKAVAKAEGRVVTAGREAVTDSETVRVVARRGPLRVVRTRHGLVLAAAGVDASNTEPGTVVPLPLDPDASARRLREALARGTGHNVAVVVTDTAGRAWREGQVDIAVGCAGLPALVDLAGRTDAYGAVLEVTAPAVADEVAAAADLVLGKAALSPAAVVSGLARLVLPGGKHGPGAAALVRAEGHDLFGLGAHDAVLAAVRRRDGDRAGFAAAPTTGPGGTGALAAALVADAAEPFGSELTVTHDPEAGTVVAEGDALAAGALGERLRVLGWPLDCAVDRMPGSAWAWQLSLRT